MQLPDLLKTVVDALITRTTPTPTPIATPVQGPIDITQILQVAIAALAGTPLPGLAAASTATGTTPPILSTIDQIFGGQALAGKKTMLSVIAYVILAIFQAHGDIGNATGTGATPAGEILTTLIGAFGALGGISKIDRLTQAVGMIATQSTPPQK